MDILEAGKGGRELKLPWACVRENASYSEKTHILKGLW